MSGASDKLVDKIPLIRETAERLYKEWASKDKRANILVFGKTGVGKSTLINTVFRDEIATTGVGRPVTQGIVEITKPGLPICILDSKGLELVDFEKIRDGLIAEVKERQGEEADRYIHLAWLCISEESKRIEDGEIALAKSLKDAGVDVIIVITKSNNFKDNEFKAVVEKEFRGICKAIHSTRSLAEDIFNDDDAIIGRREVRGIDELISSSYMYIPESQKRSFANALSIKHKKSIDVKRKESENVVTVAAASAAAAAAIPLPFSDAIALIPIQIAMVLKISHTFGMEVDRTVIMPVVSALLGSTATTLIGRALFGAVLKFIPGIGSIVGGMISATLAAQLTRQMGLLYLDVLVELADQGRSLEISEAIGLLKEKIGLGNVNG